MIGYQWVFNNKIILVWMLMGSGVRSITFPLTYNHIPCVASATIYGSTDNRTTSTLGYNSGLFAVISITTTSITRTGTTDGCNVQRRFICVGY